jgi:hypothetical protein
MGVLLALNATVEFVLAIPAWRENGFAQPLSHLAGAILDLDEGAVHPTLEPLKKAGRPTLTHSRSALNAYAAVTLELLIRLGEEETRAATKIANHLHSLGVRQPGHQRLLSAKTIQIWRDTYRTASNKSFGAQIYRELMADAVQLPDNRPAAERDLLERLSAVALSTSSAQKKKNPT